MNAEAPLTLDTRAFQARLASLFKRCRQQPAQVQTLKDILALCSTCQQLCKANPDKWFAQAVAQTAKLPSYFEFSARALFVLELLRIRNQINDNSGQHLLAMLVGVLATNQQALEHWLTNEQAEQSLRLPAQWQAAFNKAQMDVWCEGFVFVQRTELSSLQSGKPPVLNTRYQRMVWLALRLALLMTTNAQVDTQRFADALRRVCREVPPDWLPFLRPLLHYPGLVPSGSLVKTDSGQLRVICHIGHHRLYARPQAADSEQPCESVTVSRVSQVARQHKLASAGRFDALWQLRPDASGSTDTLLSPFHTSYRLDTPPAVLMDIQQHLRQQDVNIDTLAQLIADERDLASHLERTATQANRFQLPTSDIKHALMTLGYERANSMLIREALMQRLSQHEFPLRDAFYQFAIAWRHFSGQLAARLNPLDEEQAATLCNFAVSGLFTQQSLKVQTHWRPAPDKHYDVRQLVQGNARQALLDNAITLADAWRQPPETLTVLKNHVVMPDAMSQRKLVRHFAVILGLSLILTRRFMWGPQPECKDTQVFIRQGLALLGIGQGDLDNMLKDALAYCPAIIPLVYH